MSMYGPRPNQKFAILVKPENYDLIDFMLAPDVAGFRAGKYDNMYFTYTISQSHQQSVANRKFETAHEITLPWNSLNPADRKIAFVNAS